MDTKEWEEKYRASAMLAETVRHGVLVVPIGVATGLTSMLLTQVRQEERERLVKLAEGMKKECPNHDPEYPVECYGYDENYNQALSGLIKALSPSSNEKV